MRKTILLLSPHKEMGFVVAHMISTFIDGLVIAPRNDGGMAYKKYLETYFPELCSAIGADLFYSNLRNKAVHEFAPSPPLALAHKEAFREAGIYSDKRVLEGKEWVTLNVDRLSEDFLNHLDTIQKKAQA